MQIYLFGLTDIFFTEKEKKKKANYLKMVVGIKQLS
jgi:hypothetical protein